MAYINADLVKELRERTGAGIMECKKSLIETRGDIELAIDNMRKSGQAKAAKKTGRVSAEGIILTKIAQDKKYGVIIELNCETDFVAKNDIFKAFGDEVIIAALNEHISDIKELKAKFEEKRIELIAKIGENININRLGVLKGDMLGSYLHGTRIGVIVLAYGMEVELVKHIAMHIAARKPEYVNADDIPADVVAREHRIQMDIAMQSGKPRKIVEKIVEGRIRKFTNEISLTGQDFVMDPNKTVGQLLGEHGAKVNNFIRFEVGEKHSKVKANFAADLTVMDTSKKLEYKKQT
ncbi:translation elongation factor Ts [Sodalis endosymbiont of Henestaris halophilus]|uniref:translation elongation factor Ts n=1 Tax=Sodalis endosymbiont of Henestaris halophilus TaxID=1929246 RepID=UPI000BBF42DC|nr:translation elongation factor Ts [Sodalis endosymbiont of Henestaris halophilus]SNC58309.1 Elongation factor Ts [Sodalis endosymbiont of Henestaris halophilus]